jgi:hypothetical protein
MKRLNLAIDFDGTIVEIDYPRIGELIEDAKYYINKLYEDGHVIIINSCRAGKEEEDMRKFLILNGIKFHYLNENTKALIMEYGKDCRKMSADIYIDDKQLTPLPAWDMIYSIVNAVANGKTPVAVHTQLKLQL